MSIVAIVALASLVLMLSCASPELIWDEADYASNVAAPWSFLWATSDYNRHGHGPMAIYLAKLGEEVLPHGVLTVEVRLRAFISIVASLAVGLVYWTLRHSFRTSRASAIAGSSLLLFSVIRIEETHILGPHHLMMVCTLSILGLGYQWRDRPTPQAALVLGAVMAFGGLSMTYVIPAALCWGLAVSLAGGGWFAWDRSYFKASWSIVLLLAAATTVVLAFWPPGVLHREIINDFRSYLHYPNFPTRVGNRIFEVTPRWAPIYWLAHLDTPILLFSTSVTLTATWRAIRNGTLSSKHAYLSVFLSFFLATMLAAHLAGARNMLQLVAVGCLATGALFDEALGHRPRLIRFGSAAVVILSLLNLVWLSQVSSYVADWTSDGYRAFLKENETRLAEKSKALVLGGPILRFYAQQSGTSLAWDLKEMPWTTRADVPISPDIQYVLINSLVYSYMPVDQPMRRVVAERWKIVWSHRVDHSWELRLYERP
jgi:hypothetical protein